MEAINILYCIHTEDKRFNQTRNQVVIFHYVNVNQKSTMDSLVLSFQFKSIEFNKKRTLPFFLAIELLSNQKCVVSLSRRNHLSWKIQKGILVGCKVTLRGQSMYSFIDRLNFTFSRIEKLQPSYNFMANYYKKHSILKRSLITNFTYNILLTELFLFYPIELGLGLHPDVQKMRISFKFTAFSMEERFFFLRQSKIPVFPLKSNSICL